MFCSKCGTKTEQSVKFCPNCGANLSTENRPTPTELSEQPEGGHLTLTDYTLGEVKLFAKSPLVLAAAAIFTLGILLSFQGSPFRWLTSLLSMITDDPEIEYIAAMISQYIGTANVVIGVITHLPDILIAIGMWIILISAFNKDSVQLSSGGLTLIKVITIIQFIGSLIIPIILPNAILAIIGEFFIEGDSTSQITTGIVIAYGICAVVIVALIFYYTKFLRTINNIRYTVTTGTPIVKISGFIIFCCFASGIVRALLSLFNIVDLLNAVATILFGIILKKYKNKMIDLRDNGGQYIETISENN